MHRCLVDVFIMALPGDNQAWREECLASLKDQPVNIQTLAGEPGNIGVARIKGFALGSAEYVAYVDPDDTVRPGAFQACMDALDANPKSTLAYTREVKVNQDGILMASFGKIHYEPYFNTPYEPYRAHHLTVYRRSALPELAFLADYPMMPEFALKEKLHKLGPFAFVDMLGYVWRQHSGQATKSPMEVTPQTRELCKRVKEALWQRNL